MQSTILVSVAKAPRENDPPKILRIQWAVINSEMTLARGFSFFIQDEAQSESPDQCGIGMETVSQYGKPIEYVLKKFIYDYGQCQVIAGPEIEADLAILGAEAKRLEIVPSNKIETKVKIESEDQCTDLNSLIKKYVIQAKSGIFV